LRRRRGWCRLPASTRPWWIASSTCWEQVSKAPGILAPRGLFLYIAGSLADRRPDAEKIKKGATKTCDRMSQVSRFIRDKALSLRGGYQCNYLKLKPKPPKNNSDLAGVTRGHIWRLGVLSPWGKNRKRCDNRDRARVFSADLAGYLYVDSRARAQVAPGYFLRIRHFICPLDSREAPSWFNGPVGPLQCCSARKRRAASLAA
jgi:hypothetical protein